MGPSQTPGHDYFAFGFPQSGQAWRRFETRTLLTDPAAAGDAGGGLRLLAERINAETEVRTGARPPLPAEWLMALRTLSQALRHVAEQYFRRENPGCLERCRTWADDRLGSAAVAGLYAAFVELFPPLAVHVDGRSGPDFLAAPDSLGNGRDRATVEMLLLFLTAANPAAGPACLLFDDDELRRRASFVPFVTGLEEYLDLKEPPGGEGVSLLRLLRAPLQASPDSLEGQLAYIAAHWGHLLPPDLIRRLTLARDLLREVDVRRGGAPGPAPVLEFFRRDTAGAALPPEPEAFSRDADWMSNVVLMAKSVYVWLDQLSRWHGRPLHRLDEIPDQELDRLARWGVNGLWLIGLWERSSASRRIKRMMGNPEAEASAYALKEYRIAADLGGEDAWRNLRDRALARGIRLASDMVPNHMGLDSTWVVEHPEYFLQLEHPPYPAYRFSGEDLCETPGVAVRIEDGYWQHRDAAVVFQRVDERSGDVRYLYHGNDGTSMPWNDTAQLNFLLPEVREAVTRTILDVARQFPIIRFDAAMTLARKHYQRLWYPAPGDAGAIPSRAEHGLTRAEFEHAFPAEFWRQVVDRVAAEVPDTLLLAEAFWLMEGFFVRTLGMHRVYNSAFMNMLKMEENSKYRQTIKNVLEFSPPVLQRFVNFMNNPDEKTAVEQFGRGDKYFGCALLLVTMPGLPMLGHGQVEGFSEKYGMEYRRAYWDEAVDQDLVRRHERQIFPLMRRRHLFSGAEHFALYDLVSDGGWVDENVFAYSNRSGGERALILYNNCYESTSGRIHLSTAINTGSADRPHLERRTLAQALALDPDGGDWVVLSESLEDRQYLRPLSDFTREGLTVTLRGYQAWACVEIRQLHDPDGGWARLAAELQGSGVPDLARARRRLEIAPALARLRATVDLDLLARLEAQTLAPLAAAETPPDGAEPPPPLVLRHRRLLQAAAGAELGPASRRDLTGFLADLPGSRILQALFLREVVADLPGPWSAAPSVEILGTVLTPADADLLLEDLIEHLVQWTGHPYAAEETALLAWILAGADAAAAALLAGRTDWLAAFLRQPVVERYLHVHRHEGVRYLRREALEALLQGVLALGFFSGEPLRPAGALDAVHLIQEAAAAAGYRVDDLAAALAPPQADNKAQNPPK